MDVEDWRYRMMPDSRQKIVNKISGTLEKHLPSYGEASLELRQIAEKFEEKMYNAATSQSDYLRKISLKMLTMESASQTSLRFSQAKQRELVELERAAETIEQDMRDEAISQPDYIRKISVLEDAFNEFNSPKEPESACG